MKAHKLGAKYRHLMTAAKAGAVSIKIKHAARYYYASSTDVSYSLDFGSYQKTEDQAEAVVKLIEQERMEMGMDIYASLESAFYAELEDDAVISALESCEIQFLADGSTYQDQNI
jgi:outer membrane protein TolC